MTNEDTLSRNADLAFYELMGSTGRAELKVFSTAELIESGQVPAGVVYGLAGCLKTDC